MGVCEKRFPVNAYDYKLYEEIGEGVSATVYRALCIPCNEVVAIKVFDLEKWSDDLDGIRREVHTMSLIDHPNVLRAHCSFAAGNNLWVVMPYMAGGSGLHIMKTYYLEGFEEPVIATLLFETLKAVVYLHSHGHIHRDVKAGNILLDTNGKVKLGDFGVSACMFDTGDRQRCRNTFVGTPCWMAPEVMQQLHGYDFKADIWSFGITALELAHGHAPLSKYPPMKVLLMTLQNSPPCLDYERDKRFSKSFREMIAACLVKDPKKRPTSEKLLKHKFFRYAKSSEYLAGTILDGLPPLGERFRLFKEKEADLLLRNKTLYDKEQLSQKKYIRSISAWKFDLEDLRRQAALIQDDDDSPTAEKANSGSKQREGHDGLAFFAEKPSPETTNLSNNSGSYEDGLNDLDSLEGPPASFPIMLVQAIKKYFEVGDDDLESTECKISGQEASEVRSPKVDDQQVDRTNGDNLVQSSSLPKFVTAQQKKVLSGPLLYENVGSSKRDNMQPRYSSGRNNSQISFHQKGETNNHLLAEDSREGAVVRQKGRFQVTSADVNSKIAPGSARERELLAHIMQLQQRVGSLVDELQREKLKNTELERRLEGFVRKDERSTV